MNNIYYNPQAYGAEVVGEFEWSEPDWSFDMLVVWRTGRGQYWIGEDSGCSCPSPFEEVLDINSLDGPYTKDGLRKRINQRIEERKSGQHDYGYSKSELKRFAREILNRL